MLAQIEKHQKISETKEKYIFLRQMAQETQDPYASRHQLLNVFLPARDTSGVAISNVMFELARHPASWESLRAEVQGIGDQPLTFELVKSLKVAKAIINETLRLHAPASMVMRVAQRHHLAGWRRSRSTFPFIHTQRHPRHIESLCCSYDP
jgi:cytochrome P450